MANADFTKEELANEIWKPVVGYETIYSVSSIGRVKRDTATAAKWENYVLKPRESNCGYLRVWLYSGRRGTQKPISIHRLVAFAFLGNPVGDQVYVNHKDGNKQNNKVENLEWISRRGNIEHASKVLGTFPRGETNGSSKLKDADVARIKSLIIAGYKNTTIAHIYGVTPEAISSIRLGKSWKHIEPSKEAEKCPTCGHVLG